MMVRIKSIPGYDDILVAGSPVSGYAKAMLAALIGVALGLAATDISTSRGLLFGRARSGAWTTWPYAGAAVPDPYTQAILARRGEAPLGNGEGIGFFAYHDSEGRQLEGTCIYTLSSTLPAARYWTLALMNMSGRPLVPGVSVAEITGDTLRASKPSPERPDDQRQFVTSSYLLRRADSTFSLTISPVARPGNWLASRPGAFLLALYLYDSNLNDSNLVSQSALEGLPMPVIRRESCQG